MVTDEWNNIAAVNPTGTPQNIGSRIANDAAEELDTGCPVTRCARSSIVELPELHIGWHCRNQPTGRHDVGIQERVRDSNAAIDIVVTAQVR